MGNLLPWYRREIRGKRDRAAELARGAPNSAGTAVQVESNVLLPAQDVVARVPLEVILDFFSGIEFRGEDSESFEVQSGIRVLNLPDVRAFVNAAAVAHEDDVPAQMPEEPSEQLGHLRGLKLSCRTCTYRPSERAWMPR